MTFQRVNGGVGFGTFDVLLPLDANRIRLNAEFEWIASAMRFRRDEFDLTNMGESSGSTFGPVSWMKTRGCYAALSYRYGSPERQVIASIGAAGSVSLSELYLTAPTWLTTGQRFVYEVTGAGAGIIQAGSSSSGMTIAGSDAFGAWSDLSTISGFSANNGAMCQVGNYGIFAGSETAKGSIAVAAIDLAGGSTKKATSASISGSFDSLATDGTTAAATGQSSDGRFVTIAGASTGTDFTISPPGDAGFLKRIAWDARLSQWVVMASGSSGGGFPGDLFFAQRADLTTFGSGTWKRTPLAMAKFVLDDFTITAQGIWCVIGHETFNGGGYYRHDVVLCSIDGGATWTKHSLGIVGYVSSGGPTTVWRFASTGGPLIVATQRASSDCLSVVTGGLFDLGATLTSVTV